MDEATMRAEAPAPGPAVSLVIATKKRASELRALLDAVEPRCRERGAELVVAGMDEQQAAELQPVFPAVIFADAPSGADTAELRSLGTAAASGDIIILSDDTRPLPEEWLTTHA